LAIPLSHVVGRGPIRDLVLDAQSQFGAYQYVLAQKPDRARILLGLLPRIGRTLDYPGHSRAGLPLIKRIWVHELLLGHEKKRRVDVPTPEGRSMEAQNHWKVPYAVVGQVEVEAMAYYGVERDSEHMGRDHSSALVTFQRAVPLIHTDYQGNSPNVDLMVGQGNEQVAGQFVGVVDIECEEVDCLNAILLDNKPRGHHAEVLFVSKVDCRKSSVVLIPTCTYPRRAIENVICR